jgi:hypothetical protein
MRLRSILPTLVTLTLLAPAASAQTRETAGRQRHGDRAYRDALRFAQSNRLPHFTVQSRGVQRVVVNVPQDKLQDWCRTFSKERCYIEPFFSASNRSAPGWSYLRIGDKSYRQYGQGSSYYPGSGRVMFPCSLTRQELSQTEHVIQTSRNGSFRYGGGDPHTTGRNCTNWVTYKIGRFTGVTTGSVKHHMSALVSGSHSDRMTVMAVTSQQPMQNFGQDQLRLRWH